MDYKLNNVGLLVAKLTIQDANFTDMTKIVCNSGYMDEMITSNDLPSIVDLLNDVCGGPPPEVGIVPARTPMLL